MADPKTLVERFYREIWDHTDEGVAREILAPDFRFRGSLGPEKSGPEGFIEYLRAVHAALAGFESIVEDLILTNTRAAARLRFAGVHRNELFGISATGKRLEWDAVGLFEVANGKIASLWLLGDVDAVRRQLGAAAGDAFR